MRRWKDAQRAFGKALDIDGDSAQTYEGMAATLLKLKRPKAAAQHALSAINLLHHLPRSHLRLGVALARLRMHEQAMRHLKPV